MDFDNSAGDLGSLAADTVPDIARHSLLAVPSETEVSTAQQSAAPGSARNPPIDPFGEDYDGPMDVQADDDYYADC